jgi:putative two-component system response regulator
MRARPLVLIVEDEPDILMLLRVLLEMNGYETALASDGFVALERFDAERPDLVLLDLMLPVKDGWSVLADLQSRPHSCPVVICSAARSARDIDLASERGAAAILNKPLDPDLLLSTIERAIEGSRMPAEPAGYFGEIEGIQPA